MLISDLIDDLLKYREMYGDIPVVLMGKPGESEDNLVPVHGFVPIAEEDSNGTPKELVICGEELYDDLYETHEHF